MKSYKIVTRRGCRDILAHLDDMKWKPGVSASYCPSDAAGGHNYEIHSYDNKVVAELGTALAKTIVNRRQIKLDTLAVECLRVKFNKYYGGGEYKSHVDGGFVGPGLRTDYAVTLMLSDPDSFEGGELWIGGETYKPEQGYAVIYECGEPHLVTPVTEGERICAITWLQSSVQDPYKRKLLIKFQQFMIDNKHDDEVFTKAGEIFYALQKMWIHTPNTR